MASYRDWMLIENPNELDEQQLKKAVQSMGSVANKRLRRMENRGINFGENIGEDNISGVKKFTVRDKSYIDLKNEFKRVRNFLNDPQSSLTGMKRVYKEFKEEIKKARKLTRAETKEYTKMRKQKRKSGIRRKTFNQWEELRQWRDTWTFYNRLVEEGYYAPSEYDSKQVRDTVISAIRNRDNNDMTDEETWKKILKDLQIEYEEAESEELEESDTTSTSSFFSAGGSD